jgi:hypothetical protein
MSPKKDAPGSTILCTTMLNIMTKSSNSNSIASSLFILHAVQSINFTSSLFKVRTWRIGQLARWIANPDLSPLFWGILRAETTRGDKLE